MDRPQPNSDGSVDIHFGPEKLDEAENWLATVRGRGFFIILRLYGPDQPYFDQTWKPADLVKVI
jgi:hypothetical protein